MDQANQDQPQVCSLTVWVSPDGDEYAVPPELQSVRITKSGMPDKRGQRYEEFMLWTESLKGSRVVTLEHENREFVGEAIYFQISPAQSLASRIWEGQSPDLPRAERMHRVKAGLEAQGMSMEGVTL